MLPETYDKECHEAVRSGHCMMYLITVGPFTYITKTEQSSQLLQDIHTLFCFYFTEGIVMDIIIALLCFLGLMSYEEAGVTQQQVEAELRNRNVNVETAAERVRPHIIDRTEGD
jgi:hypothetical protein